MTDPTSFDDAKQALLDAYTPTQLRDLARAHSVRVAHPTLGKKPIGMLLEDLVNAGVRAGGAR